MVVLCFRHLLELELQLALDATEEGLLAIAGRSALEFDQGLTNHHHHPPHPSSSSALYLHRDFGPAKDWYVKDALLFTPPPQPSSSSSSTTSNNNAAVGGLAAAAKRAIPPPCDSLLRTFPTGFGCTRLRRFRLAGDFIFPPMVARAKVPKAEAGPVVEVGLYALLLQLKQLQQFCFSFAPLAVAR